MVYLFHRTEEPEAIMRDGFASTEWKDIGGRGVWFGSMPEATMSGHGDYLIVVEVEDSRLEEFRASDSTGPYADLFFIPEDVVNELQRVRVDASPRSSL